MCKLSTLIAPLEELADTARESDEVEMGEFTIPGAPSGLGLEPTVPPTGMVTPTGRAPVDVLSQTPPVYSPAPTEPFEEELFPSPDRDAEVFRFQSVWCVWWVGRHMVSPVCLARAGGVGSFDTYPRKLAEHILSP